VKRLALISAAACLGLAGVGIAAARDGGPADGTLVVKNGIGSVQFNGKGAVLGHIDHGFVQIKDPIPGDGPEPIVNGAESAYDINAKTTRYAGTDIRFRMIGGRFTITVVGSGIDLSIVAVTKDAKALAQALVADGPSTVVYEADQPPELLEEDRRIGALKLGIRPEAVRTTRVEEVFAR